MPMFDDPKKELSRMQRVLLEEDESFDAPRSEEDWLDDELAEIKELLGMNTEEDAEGAAYRSYAKRYNKQQARAAVRADYRDVEDEEEKKPVNDARGQQILTFLLVLGILAVAGYWVSILL